jgi:hypothetical protein
MRLAKGSMTLAHRASALLAVRHGEDDAVVLVGIQRLLQTPLRAQRQPAELDLTDLRAGCELQLDDPVRQQVVQRSK